MRQLVPLACLALAVAGCRPEPRWIVTPAGPFTEETLIECGCLPVEPAGTIVGLMAPDGTFASRAQVIVRLAGVEIQRASAGSSGAVAMLVADRRPLAGATLDVEVAGNHYAVTVPAEREATVETSGFAEVGRDDLVATGVVRRSRALAGCPPDVEPPEATDVVEVWAGNVSRGTASRVADRRALPTVFEAHVTGGAGDVALVAIRHADGGTSGWILAGGDICCGCAGGGGWRFPRASCARPAGCAGGVDAGPPDAGSDAGRDAPPWDAPYDEDAEVY